jgi:predicted nucleotidyltransferase component of viral defense system
MHQLINSLKSIKDSLERKGSSQDFVRVALKEELQNYVLAAIYNDSRTNNLVFVGGTCLRKLFGLNRLSEDLDFENPDGLSLELIANVVIDYFKSIEFDAFDYNIQESENVSRLTLRFSILNEIGLSPFEDEKLHVKIETTSGFAHTTLLTPYAHDNLTMLIKHSPLETLMAGKISACLHRVWENGTTGIKVKGRDYYDLIWYMQKGTVPDVNKFVNEAMGSDLTLIFKALDAKVAKIKTGDLFLDLRGFFESEDFIKSWCATFHELYKRYRVSY